MFPEVLTGLVAVNVCEAEPAATTIDAVAGAGPSQFIEYRKDRTYCVPSVVETVCLIVPAALPSRSMDCCPSAAGQ